ncbi:hypothetical protein NDU88_004224 [Pleurodeles waltl]|uniref:Uncharacterized protein n=1 Tax=Pleurodeles waltl TaxID=8319 RepID=A0AAV7VJM6_PLEWA|nr:hypothetical protein NDU88_004224 [Pleurodeles waltl]
MPRARSASPSGGSRRRIGSCPFVFIARPRPGDHRPLSPRSGFCALGFFLSSARPSGDKIVLAIPAPFIQCPLPPPSPAAYCGLLPAPAAALLAASAPCCCVCWCEYLSSGYPVYNSSYPPPAPPGSVTLFNPLHRDNPATVYTAVLALLVHTIHPIYTCTITV